VDNIDFVERDRLCSGSLDLYNDVSLTETPYCKMVGWLVDDYLEGIWKGFGRKPSSLFQHFPESGYLVTHMKVEPKTYGHET
jgi:hypothetical protein